MAVTTTVSLRSPSARLKVLAICLLACTGSAAGLINAGLQPVDLVGRYRAVVAGEIVRVDSEQHRLEVRITSVFKGDYKPGQIVTVSAVGEMAEALAQEVEAGKLKVGAPIAAFVGRSRRRRAKELLFYAGGFYLGRMDGPDRWSWTDSDKEMVGTDGKKIPSLAGTWNGSTEDLIRMLGDIRAGRAYFPRKAYACFRKDNLLDKFDDTPVRGVALYDIDGDGDLDVYACSDEEDRLYLQMEPMKFVNATDHVGLEVASPSCSFADVDADGRADLLAGGIILRGRTGSDGILRLEQTEWLPYEANEDLKSSAFVEINGDGYPDVIISKLKGGLRVYLNPGPKTGPFTDATAAAGLDRKANGAGRTGFFAPGDWNGDGRCDLFYAAGKGLLLTQNDKGVFSPVKHDIGFRFASGEQGQEGLTGAGCFMPILGQDRLDLIVPTESSWHVVANRRGVPVDVTEYGNEISEGSYLHLATIAEDLNLDGYVDFYTTSRTRNGHNRFIINRGYGSFMLASVHKHYEHMFNGPAHTSGGWGVAAGDVNDDGAPDLLLGNTRGHLFLILNDTLTMRKPVAHPTDDMARLLKVRILTVRVTGRRGVLGARLTVHDEAGRVVARRDIGSNVAVGCRGPDVVNFALRDPGKCTLTVRYADGLSRSWPVDLSEKPRVKIRADRKDKE